MNRVKVKIKKNASSKSIKRNFLRGKVYNAEFDFYKNNNNTEETKIFRVGCYVLGEGLFHSNFELYNRVNRIDDLLDAD